MRYLGNKTSLSKELIPIITKRLNGKNWYIEPFCGALGMISNIDYPKRMAYDKDKYIVFLMQAVRDGWIPPLNISEDIYNKYHEMFKNDEVEHSKLEYAEIAFAGYGCSFGGKWFGGFASGGTNKGIPRNYASESSRNLLKMKPKLQNMIIEVCDYRDIVYPDESVLYCDPPYSTGTKYKTKFNHIEFWDWIRKVSLRNYVYVSEYNAPNDFNIIWHKQHKTGINNKAIKHKKTIEKLFTYRDGKVLNKEEN